jgi:hypothetical protein
VALVGLGIVFVLEYYTQIGIGRYPVTTSIYSNLILRSGHLANLSPLQRIPTWENLTWVDVLLPFPGILIAEMSSILGLSPRILAFFPIGAPLLIAYFALALALTKRTWFAAFYTFGYLVPSGFLDVQQINRVSLGWVLFGFLLLVLFVQRRRNVGGIVCSTLLLLAIGFTYYTISAFALATVICFAGYSYLVSRLAKKSRRAAPYVGQVTVLIALASFVQSSILYTISLNMPTYSSPSEFVAFLLTNFFSAAKSYLGLSSPRQFTQLSNVPIPPYLQNFLVLQRFSFLVVALSVLLWALYAVVTVLRKNEGILQKHSWKFAGAFAALAMVLADVAGYSPLKGTIDISIAGIIGVLLLLPPQRRKALRPRSVSPMRILYFVVLVLIISGSTINLAVVSSVGFVGAHPEDGSLYLPISVWYGSHSNGKNLATGNVILSSMLALFSEGGNSISTLSQNVEISGSLASKNQSALGVALRNTNANLYAFTTLDETRPSWGDVWGYVAPEMDYSGWFYSLPITNIVYNNGNTLIDSFG